MTTHLLTLIERRKGIGSLLLFFCAFFFYGTGVLQARTATASKDLSADARILTSGDDGKADHYSAGNIVHLSPEFGENDEVGSDHDPIVTSIDLVNLFQLPKGGQEEQVYQIVSGNDDAEEMTNPNAAGRSAEQGAALGFVDLGSSDIELVDDSFNGPNQIVGLRFANIDIPRGAIIAEAYLRFTLDADGEGSGADVVRTYIQIESDINPGSFTEDLFSVSSREVLADKVVWEIGEVAPEAADAREKIQSVSIAQLVQKQISNPNWTAGNSLGFRITGDGGERDLSSANNDLPNAGPELIIRLLPANTLVAEVLSSSDDAEEMTDPENAGRTAEQGAERGFVDLGSSDLEIVDDSFNGPNQFVGVRFAGLNIPQGALINSAFIQFVSDTDGAGSGNDIVNSYIQVEDNANASTFTSDLFSISSRNVADDTVFWDIDPITNEQVTNRALINTPDVSKLVQLIVNKGDWEPGNAISFIITGEGGERDFSSFDDNDIESPAPKLIIDFVETEQFISVAQSADDAEEVTAEGVQSGLPVGGVDVTSSDIEVVDDGFNGPKQIIGLRFGSINIDAFTPIESAFIEFTLDTDGAGSSTEVQSYIQIENTVDAEPFTSALFNISNREVLDDMVSWVVPIATQEQLTNRSSIASANISSLVQKIINSEGWEAGNALGFRITGEGGERDFSSADDDGPEVAPRLVINFAKVEGNQPPQVIAQIPDVNTTVGGSFTLDLNNFFIDEDTPLEFYAVNLLGEEVPFIDISEEGILRGSIDEPIYLPIEVLAVSLGDTVSSVFDFSASPLRKGVLKQLSTIKLGGFEESAAEISAFDPISDRLFVTNAETDAIEILNYSDPTNPTLELSVDISTLGVAAGGINSVAVRNGILAAAIENENKQGNGWIITWNTSTLAQLNTYEVGALPDMVTFADDNTIVVANEGEPSDDYTVDPEGSVSIIDLTNADLVAAVSTADFTAFNGQEDALRAEGARIFGPNATVAQDLEPEYITVEDGKAYVTLQENNAIAVVDIESATVESVIGLGFKDHSLAGNGIDANNDRGTPIFIDNRLPILGMYQPDAIASIVLGGDTYLLTANEGDARDYDAFSEETEIGDIKLDPNSFGDIDKIERLAEGLTVSAVEADTTVDGKYKELFAYGTRSFSIWKTGEDGGLVFDSGDDFEQITASLYPDNFNASNSNNTFKNRSDNKGPEPEAIAVGKVGDALYAFIGLERIGGIMVYDVTNPETPEFIEYFNNRDFSLDEEDSDHGDLGPEGLVFVPASESPNGAALLIVSNEISGTVTTYQVGEAAPLSEVFTLELLHVTDQEAAGPAIQDAPRLSAVMNALEAQDLGDDNLPDNTIKLSSGDVFLPGLFRDASIDLFGTGGVADMQIQNELGFQAVAFGNHEFDFGTGEIAKLISGLNMGEPIAVFEDPAFDGTDLEGTTYSGTNFPYLSGNLDFSTDANMAPLEIKPGLSPVGGKVSSTTVINVNGESIGVVGATTPFLKSIASPGNVGVSPDPFAASPSADEIAALAEIIQEDVDALLADNPEINKVILLAHMQQIEIEFALAPLLKNVDIIVAGGSNTRLFDENDRPRAGDSNQGMYPTLFEDANGDTVAVVNTDAQYKYVGRLVIDFDAEGKIIPSSYDPMVSGAYATDEQGVADLNAENLVDPEIQALASAVESTIIAKESVILGRANVFLNGNRSGKGTGEDPDGVRTQETNLGNLTADANLAAAKAVEADVVVSIKNGGGIRASIGRTIVPAGGSGEAERLPNEELIDSEGNLVKPEGGISQNDIATSLAFNNGLSLLTLTKEELKAILEHGVAQSPVVDGRFPQVAGVKFSFDDTKAVGSRIQNAAIVDEDGEIIEQFVADGAIVASASATYRIVTLNFLATGGDGYPFPTGASANRVDLYDLNADGINDGATGGATFANDGTEQDALAEYLLANFNTEQSAFSGEDAGPSSDERIQNLAFRADGLVNVAPVLVAPIADVTVDEGFSTTTIDLSVVFTDASTLTYSATSGTQTVVTAAVNGSILTLTEVGVGTSTITVSATDGEFTTTDEFTVTVNQVLGLGDDLKGLSMYPVPATSEIIISHQSMNITHVRVISLGGRLMKAVPLNNGKLDVSDLESGMYMIELFDANTNKSINSKIIKQ